MIDDKPATHFTICACHGEGMHIDYWNDDQSFYVSLWVDRDWRRVGWVQRLRHIWRILTVGEPWHDEIVLNREEAARLAAFLQRPTEEP